MQDKYKNKAMKICIIGSGRLGLTLACAIDGADSDEASVVSVSSRTENSIGAAKEILANSSREILFTRDNLLAAQKANCIFICTPDDEIEKICHEIFGTSAAINIEDDGGVITDSAKTLKEDKSIKNPSELTVFHFSGSKKTNILDLAARAGASVACMHPLKSFASPTEAVKTLENTLYGITYDRKDTRAKKNIDILLAILKGRNIFVENDNKTLYHACACIASNYLVSLMDFAADAGAEIGLDPHIFLSGLISLSEGTLINIKKLGTKKALTGPVARGDTSTIREHVEKINSLNRDDILELYTFMGEKTAKIAFENTWINVETYNELVKIFKK